jgi:hypothetical protein
VASSVLEVFAVAVPSVLDLYCWCWVLEEAVDCVSGIAVHVLPLLVQSVSVPVAKGLDQGVGGPCCVGSLKCLDKEVPGWASGSALVVILEIEGEHWQTGGLGIWFCDAVG